MPQSSADDFNAAELTEHILVWHMVSDGVVHGVALAESFERQAKIIGNNDFHAHQHFAILSIMARYADRYNVSRYTGPCCREI